MYRKLFLLLLTLFIISQAFAQSRRDIETDLLTLFIKIDPQGEDYGKANDLFAKKLQYYTEKYPSTIGQNFDQLKKKYVDISTSADGLFRIYSWDTETGGTMHFFESVFQYKTGGKTVSVIDTPKTEGEAGVNYFKIYTIKTKGKTYYLSLYLGVESSKYQFRGVNVFAIEDGKLNHNVKLIKTKTGMHSQLSYEYDFSAVIDWKIRSEISFDPATNTIRLPLVLAGGELTHRFITYRFTGQYFEKVKS